MERATNPTIATIQNTDKGTPFYNTIHLQNEDLEKAKKQAETQESKILDFLKANSLQDYTKHEIKINLSNLGLIKWNTPESSISRALSNLQNQSG